MIVIGIFIVVALASNFFGILLTLSFYRALNAIPDRKNKKFIRSLSFVLGIPTIFLMLGVISFCAAMVVAARLLYDDVSNYHFHLRVSCASPLACHARAVRCATTCCVSCVCGCVVFVPSLTLGGGKAIFIFICVLTGCICLVWLLIHLYTPLVLRALRSA